MIDSFHGEFRFLSNFELCWVTMYGEVYRSTEHAYQAAKTLDRIERAKILEARTPGEAKRLGRRVTLRADWDEFRLVAMEELLRRKFADPALRTKLMLTAGHELVEGNTWGDTFWGVCRGKGENHLGRLLMKIREECRA